MATFTMRLSDVWEQNRDVGLFHYPIFREAYRGGLNRKIMDHYWNQEIGMETPNLFVLAVKRRMNEIMPYYNQLYSSELLKIDPLLTVDILTETDSEMTGTTTGTGQTESSNESKSRSVQSEFPQHQLAGDQDYATAAADSVSDGNTTAESTESSQNEATNSGKSRTSGIQGYQSDMLIRYRETFLNIDLMVIDELRDCFMAIWNNDDNYTQSRFGPYMYGIGW